MGRRCVAEDLDWHRDTNHGVVTYLATPDFDPMRSHRLYPQLLRALGLHDQPIAQWKGRAPAISR